MSAMKENHTLWRFAQKNEEEEQELKTNRPKIWGEGRRCSECGNKTWECPCVGDNMSEE